MPLFNPKSVAHHVAGLPPQLHSLIQLPHRPQDLSDYQRAHKLDRMLSPLEWVSYLFSAGNLLAGASLACTCIIGSPSALRRIF